MPYRRLPTTDQARLRVLKVATSFAEKQNFGEQVIPFNTLQRANTALNGFEKQLIFYQQTRANQIKANKSSQQIVSNARMYISHFIQVLNLSVIRGDIKKDHKSYYQLDSQIHTVPDLSTDNALLEWGKKIIDGEQERVRNGGLPIYNPAIAKVQVHYEVFKEYKSTHKNHQMVTGRHWYELVVMRKEIDTLILEMWNQVEEMFKNEKPYTKLVRCQELGVVYYYRKGEKKLTE